MATIGNADQAYKDLLAELEAREDYESYQALITHPQFEKNFKKRCEEFAEIGAQIEFTIDHKGINLNGIHEYDAKGNMNTSFEYQGSQTKTRYHYGIEDLHEREYLCERMEQAQVLRFEERDNSDLSWTSGLTAYYGDEEICRAMNYKERYVPDQYWAHAYYDTFVMSEIPLGYAIGGEVPPNAKNGSPKCTYDVTTRTTPGYNIIKQVHYTEKSGKPTAHIVSYGTASSRYPTTLDDVSSNLAQENIITGKKWFCGKFKDLKECLDSVPSYYDAENKHML